MYRKYAAKAAGAVKISRSPIRELQVAAILFGLSASAALAQDLAAGEISFSRCLGCHAIGVNAKNKIGPQLNGIDGRKCGTADGYAYSAANKDCAFTWNEADFVQYIRDPKAKIPGTKMIYAGLKDEQKTNDLIAFLKQYDADGKKQ